MLFWILPLKLIQEKFKLLKATRALMPREISPVKLLHDKSRFTTLYFLRKVYSCCPLHWLPLILSLYSESEQYHQ